MESQEYQEYQEYSRPPETVAQSIYTGTASIGRWVEFVGAIFATIVGIVLIILGINAWYNGKNSSGLYLILSAVIIILLGWIIYWLTRKSKVIAAVAGADAIWHIL